MTHYKDLDSCSYFDWVDARLIAVGWLDNSHDVPSGQATQAFFEALANLLVNPWQPVAIAGRHACSFCRFTGGPSELSVGNSKIRVGSTNLFVPTPTCVFVAPSLVLHYIDAHDYAPPEEFKEAVELCPPMHSMPYLKMIRQHGIHRIGKIPQPR